MALQCFLQCRGSCGEHWTILYKSQEDLQLWHAVCYLLLALLKGIYSVQFQKDASCCIKVTHYFMPVWDLLGTGTCSQTS